MQQCKQTSGMLLLADVARFDNTKGMVILSIPMVMKASGEEAREIPK